MSSRTVIAGALAAGFAPFAQAHPGHEGHDLTWDFHTGFAHPFTGLDHVLAMVAIGWWAAQLGGRARWFVPTIFLGVLAISGAFGEMAIRPPGLEQAIAASVLISGLFVATAARMPITAAAAIAGAFAAFHGLAHGAEMPASTAAVGYGIGFVAATAALLGLGLGLGISASRLTTVATRGAGLACAAVGLLLLVR